MEILAYIASAFIGISLGLTGGGGSILTVPVLVYMFGVSPLLSTSYSLFIVGSTSLVGAFNNYRLGKVDVRTALLFGLSSVTTVFVIRKFAIPFIPKVLFRNSDFELRESTLTMLLFATLMIFSAVAMIRGKRLDHAKQKSNDQSRHKLFIYGIGIGITTGFLGAGGGFLLIPTLVLLLGMPIKEAVGSSLLIIALNSLIGFTGDLGHFLIDWIFLFKVTGVAILGILTGGVISKGVNPVYLKKGFGWFILLVGAYIILREIILF